MSEDDAFITELLVERTFNLGNFESIKVGARISLPLGSNLEVAEGILKEEVLKLRGMMLEERKVEQSSASPPSKYGDRVVIVKNNEWTETKNPDVLMKLEGDFYTFKNLITGEEWKRKRGDKR